MNRPLTKHPDETIEVAARSLRASGLALLLFAALQMLISLLLLHGPFAPRGLRLIVEVVLPIVIVAAAGGILLACASGVRRYESWAVILGSTIAALVFLASLVLIGVVAVHALAEPGPVLAVLILLVTATATLRLWLDLRRTLAAIHAREAQRRLGHSFEPLNVRSVEPHPSDNDRPK